MAGGGIDLSEHPGVAYGLIAVLLLGCTCEAISILCCGRGWRPRDYNSSAHAQRPGQPQEPKRSEQPQDDALADEPVPGQPQDAALADEPDRISNTSDGAADFTAVDMPGSESRQVTPDFERASLSNSAARESVPLLAGQLSRYEQYNTIQ